MNKLSKILIGSGLMLFISVAVTSQNVAVIDTQAAILQTQAAQDAFKALEEEAEYSSMVEEAKELQTARQTLVERLQKDSETLSQDQITELRKDIDENGKDLEFLLGKIQTKQNETIQSIAAQLNPQMMKIINELIISKKIQILLGADQVLYSDTSVSITEQVTDALDGAADTEEQSD
tara:strand:- start:842 stop:1375 length:534 start_codon:yes stop_codon:yes gene_type:complete